MPTVNYVPLPAKTPSEQKVVTFDFTPLITPRAVLDPTLTPTVDISVVSGTESPPTLVAGTAVILPDAPMVVALVQGGADVNTYGLICTAKAINGEIHVVGATLPVSNIAV